MKVTSVCAEAWGEMTTPLEPELKAIVHFYVTAGNHTLVLGALLTHEISLALKYLIFKIALENKADGTVGKALGI